MQGSLPESALNNTGMILQEAYSLLLTGVLLSIYVDKIAAILYPHRSKLNTSSVGIKEHKKMNSINWKKEVPLNTSFLIY